MTEKGLAKSVSNIGPEVARKLLGPPPVLKAEDAKTHEQIFSLFGEAVKPQDTIEWMFVRDLTDHRLEIHHLRGLKTGLIKQAHVKKLQQEAHDIFLVYSSRTRSFHSQIDVDLEYEIKELRCDAAKVKEETERLKARAKEKIDVETKKNNAEAAAKVKEVERRLDQVDEAAVFGDWIGCYEQVDRRLDAAERRFEVVLRQLDDHRHGLGQRLREASDTIIEGEFEVDSASPPTAPIPSAEPETAAGTLVAMEAQVSLQQMQASTLAIPEPVLPPAALVPGDGDSVPV
jgi:hypothetical protein